jgi:hypothetical protein
MAPDTRLPRGRALIGHAGWVGDDFAGTLDLRWRKVLFIHSRENNQAATNY